jgi:hypothetical protein
MAAERITAALFLLSLAAVAILGGCASQVPPGGGPTDTVPPEIVSTSPGPGTLHFTGDRIEVGFSEYVDRRSFQESVFLSPSPGALAFDWGGTDVRISFPDTLRANTTYILTVGTDLKDTRNNRMAKSFALAFSTGGMIDSCTAAGTVDDASPGGVMVFAWDVDGGRGDTLNPASVKPDYLTQTGADGSFILRNMRAGAYRLMAVRDVFKNLLYDIQTDAYGMATTDFLLEEGKRSVDGIGFRLTGEDTLRPFLSGARSRNRSSILLRFNEAVDPGNGPSALTITDTADGTPLHPFDLARSDSTGRDYVVTTARQDSGAVYRVTIGSLVDAAGNRADSSGRTALFAASTEPDTVAPVVTMSIPRDSSTGVLSTDTLRLGFTEPVDTASFAGGFSVLKSDLVFPGTLRWGGPMIAEFLPLRAFEPGAWYAVRIVLDSIRDREGNVRRDSIMVRHFRMMEEKLMGSIGGRVRRGDTTIAPGAGAVIVEVRGLSGAGAGSRHVRADSSGGFLVDALPEGLYVLSAFIDANGNGVHDCGYPWPLRFAEPFGLCADTLKVRPRWPIEGVRIDIGK